MWVAGQREVGQVLERLEASRGVHVAGQRIAAEHLGHLEVQKMRRVKGLAGLEEALGHPGTGRGGEQDLEDRRSVDDGHRPSRSALTALAGGRLGVTAVRRASR